MQPRDVQTRIAHYVSVVAAALTAAHLLTIFFIGYMLVTTDWRALECFDGDEPACSGPVRDTGLSAVPAGYWLLIWAAVMATVGACVLALRVRRVAHGVAALLLCATSAIIAQGLWWSAVS